MVTRIDGKSFNAGFWARQDHEPRDPPMYDDPKSYEHGEWLRGWDYHYMMWNSMFQRDGQGLHREGG